MTSYQNNNSETIVFSTTLLIMAVTTCEQLVKAGIRAKAFNHPDGYVVVVPSADVRECEILLDGEPHFGEIYLYQK